MTHKHDFNRTVCACQQCRACCKRQPGPLAPGDFERIVEHFQKTHGLEPEVALAHVKRQLWASPGALVQDVFGEIKRIGTITPRYRHGKCVFLDDQERCTIHEVAPFGCSHFDTHMSNREAHTRSNWLAHAQQDPDYQKLRDTLPYATHHKPIKY